MTRAPFLALIAFAGLMAVAILQELHEVGRPPAMPSPAAPARLAAPVAAAGAAMRPHAGADAQARQAWTRTILERPLFSPSRRPGRVAVASTELPRLAGIIIGPSGARAIFASSGDARALIAAPGGHAGPYLVRAVGADGVSVLGPNGPERLRPAYDRNASREAVGGNMGNPAAAGAPPPTILDLLRNRVQNGLRSGNPMGGNPMAGNPMLGNSAATFPQPDPIPQK